MTVHKFVDLHFDETRYLEDLSGIARDFRTVLKACELLTENSPPNTENFDAVELYTDAILIKYARPFSTGVRERIGKALLRKLTPEQLGWHKEFMDWRNKHTAHSVNPFEHNQAVGYYIEGKEQEGFNQVAVQNRNVIGMGGVGVKNISELSQIFLDFIDETIEEQKDIILKIANQFGVLHAQKIARNNPAPHMSGVVGKPRKR